MMHSGHPTQLQDSSSAYIYYKKRKPEVKPFAVTQTQRWYSTSTAPLLQLLKPCSKILDLQFR